jgi:hypothetical protein
MGLKMNHYIRVKIAPGRVHIVSPHPSGIRELPPLRLEGGDEMLATPVEAEALYAQGKIHHPVTAKLPPERPKQINMSMVTVNGQDVLPGSVYVPPREVMEARQRAADAAVDARNAETLARLKKHNWGAEKDPHVSLTRHGHSELGPDPMGPVVFHDQYGSF